MQIRPERLEDAAAIRRVTAAAFESVPYGDGTEAGIIEMLRHAGALTISLVATGDDGEIVGHVAFSPVRIDRQPGDWYGLGPVSVIPPLQRRGIGRALIQDGLARLRALGAEGCVLLGYPIYYGRFGFVSDRELTYLGYPNPNFLRLVLKGDPPRGDVSFHPAFDAL
jgi:putative acetyltransferase